MFHTLCEWNVFNDVQCITSFWVQTQHPWAPVAETPPRKLAPVLNDVSEGYQQPPNSGHFIKTVSKGPRPPNSRNFATTGREGARRPQHSRNLAKTDLEVCTWVVKWSLFQSRLKSEAVACLLSVPFVSVYAVAESSETSVTSALSRPFNYIVGGLEWCARRWGKKGLESRMASKPLQTFMLLPC